LAVKVEGFFLKNTEKTKTMAKAKNTEKLLVLKPVSCIYGLSASVGDTIEVKDKKQRETMIESGHVQIV
jgi:hypothetical protein